MKIIKAEVVNCIQAATKYGPRLALNFLTLPDKTKGVSWCNDIHSQLYLSKKPGDIVELIINDKGKYSVLEKEESHSINTGLKSVEESNTTTTTCSSSSPREANNKDILDLPILSPADKRKLATYIQDQGRLLRFCYKTCAEAFPEMVGKDERGLRSLAISLLISANSARDKYRI